MTPHNILIWTGIILISGPLALAVIAALLMLTADSIAVIRDSLKL